VFGLSELSGAADAKTVDLNRLSARTLHTVMQ